MELGYKHFINQPVFKKIIIINIVIFLLPLVSNTFLFLFNLPQIDIIRFFDQITVMNNPMKKQVKLFSSRDSLIASRLFLKSIW